MNDPVGQMPKAVMSALRQVLRPVARLLIRHGITLPAVVELLKQVLVDVAITDFPVEGKRTTDSRISVLTGVHRKDVKRLRGVEVDKIDVPKQVSLGMQVVNAWMTDSAWLDEEGNPRPLARSSAAGDPDFEQLADSVSNGDVRARSILDELLRLEVVALRDGMVHLQTEAFVPKQGEAEKLFYFEQAGYAHLMAGVRNLEGTQPPFFDRLVQYHSIPASELPRLRAMVDGQGMALLKAINKVARQVNDPQQPDRRSVVIGLYCFDEAPRDD
jgi:hypothetical protein